MNTRLDMGRWLGHCAAEAGRLRRRVAQGLIAFAATLALVLGLGASPAYATSEGGGAYDCGSWYVTTFNYAAGTVYHKKKIGGIWDTKNFGSGLPAATRYWTWYHNVQAWEVGGTIQENENSGIYCSL